MVTWDSAFEDSPADDVVSANFENTIPLLREAFYERFTKEHKMNLASGLFAEDGWHKTGSAKAYCQASAPTLLPDGSLPTQRTKGRLWVDTTSEYLEYAYLDNALSFAETKNHSDEVNDLIDRFELWSDTSRVTEYDTGGSERSIALYDSIILPELPRVGDRCNLVFEIGYIPIQTGTAVLHFKTPLTPNEIGAYALYSSRHSKTYNYTGDITYPCLNNAAVVLPVGGVGTTSRSTGPIETWFTFSFLVTAGTRKFVAVEFQYIRLA